MARTYHYQITIKNKGMVPVERQSDVEVVRRALADYGQLDNGDCLRAMISTLEGGDFHENLEEGRTDEWGAEVMRPFQKRTMKMISDVGFDIKTISKREYESIFGLSPASGA